jgi:hypothetical protein
MPFSQEFNNVYTYAIKGACNNLGVYCERVDEQVYEGTVLERIYNQIAKSDVIVGDMTGRNPNVFYEMGYAHALEKRAVLLTRDVNDIPFDLKHFPHVIYSHNDIAALQAELEKRLAIVAFADGDKKRSEIGLELYYKNTALSNGVVTVHYDNKKDPTAHLSLHNNSAITYLPGDFVIGIETSFNRFWKDRRAIVLPNGRGLVSINDFDTLFPDAYLGLNIGFGYLDDEDSDPFDVILKVYPAAGARQFSLIFQAS